MLLLMLPAGLLLAVTFQPGAVMRSGCDAGAKVIGEVAAGTPAEIRMAVASSSGRCFHVRTAGAAGWVPASALSGLEDFDAAVRGASPVSATASAKAAPAKRAERSARPADPLAAASGLLREKQPRAALDLLERTMQDRGRSPDALVLAGMAARASDDPRTALGLLEEAYKKRPEPALESLLGSLRRELSADTSTSRLLGGRFLLRYDGATVSPELAREAVALLDREFTRISADLGCRSGEQIVTIVQTPGAYRASTDAAEWSGGLFDGHRIRIPLGGDGLGPRARTTFAHEIVHACLAGLGDWPVWLHEGMAQKLSGVAASAETHHRIRSLVRQGKLPSLDKTSQTWSRLSPRHAADAYAYALVAVETLASAYSAEGLAWLLRDPAQIPRISTELDRILRQ